MGTVREGIMATCIALLLTTSIVLLTCNGVYAKSIDNNAGDYFLDFLAPKTKQGRNAHNTFWDEQGRKHGEYWKNFFPNSADLMLKMPSAVLNGVTSMMTAVMAVQPLLNNVAGMFGQGAIFGQGAMANRPQQTNPQPTRPSPPITRPSRPSPAEEPEAVSSESDELDEYEYEYDSEEYEYDSEEGEEGSGEGSGEEAKGTRAGAQK